MLARRAGTPLQVLQHVRHSKISHKPVARRYFMSGLQEGFLDLALALPYPSGWPPYASTIILTTLVSRLFFTLPFSVWTWKKMGLVSQVIVPQLENEKPAIGKAITDGINKEVKRGLRGDPKELFRKRFTREVTKRRNALMKQHSVRPIVMTVASALPQMTLFLGTSMLFRNLAYPPASLVLDAESFLSLTSITHTDPTGTLPIAIGLLTLANTESANWFLGDQVRKQEEREEEARNALRAQGKIAPPSGRKVMRHALRALSVGRILLAMMMPGTVVIYWTASAAFGLVQTWVFDYLDRRRYQAGLVPALEAVKPADPTSALPSTKPAATSSASKAVKPTKTRNLAPKAKPASQKVRS